MIEEKWDCKTDGHEMERTGEYDPDTGSYPYYKCIYCNHTEAWEPADDSMDDDVI